jgi:hypothetical protein
MKTVKQLKEQKKYGVGYQEFPLMPMVEVVEWQPTN